MPSFWSRLSNSSWKALRSNTNAVSSEASCPASKTSLICITASGGRVPIGTLAEDLGWSHRRFIARYRDAVGLPPKTVARIVRFERASARLLSGDGLATTATECGYFDQAHMAREVREFAGITPTELRSTVNSVQDATV